MKRQIALFSHKLKQQIAKTTGNMNYDEIKARGKPTSTFRLTGRDGPPESFQPIPGVPAWLARGTPVQFVNVTMHECLNENGIWIPNA